MGGGVSNKINHFNLNTIICVYLYVSWFIFLFKSFMPVMKEISDTSVTLLQQVLLLPLYPIYIQSVEKLNECLYTI